MSYFLCFVIIIVHLVPTVPIIFSIYWVEGAYREYQSALRKFNNHLKSLSRKLRLHSSVTSYTLRHSWATTAKYRGVPIEMISESLGHKSIKTTQIYLKGFELEERTKVNKQNYYYVRRFKIAWRKRFKMLRFRGLVLLLLLK